MKDLAPALPADPPDQPANPSRRRIFQAASAVGLAASLPALADAAPGKKTIAKGSLDAKLKAHVKNVVVIYLENRSFNNLFANFPGTSAPLSAVTAEQAQQLDRDGKPYELIAEGLLAVCIQHECDHLNGKLFVDYLSTLKRDRIKKKLEKLHRQNA